MARWSQDDSPVARQAAYVAIVYLGWRQLAGIVARAADADPDEQGRELARGLLPAFG